MTGLALDVRGERGKELAMRLRSPFPTIDGLTVCSKTRKSDESSERSNLLQLLASDFKHQKTGEVYDLHAPFVDRYSAQNSLFIYTVCRTVNYFRRATFVCKLNGRASSSDHQSCIKELERLLAHSLA